MPIYALANACRSGNVRAAVHSACLFVAIAGVERTYRRERGDQVFDRRSPTSSTERPTMRRSRCRASRRVGMDVVMRLGSVNNLDRIFAGQVANVEAAYVDTPSLRCSPATDRLHHRPRQAAVIQRFHQPGDVIAKAIISGYTSGYDRRRREQDRHHRRNFLHQRQALGRAQFAREALRHCIGRSITAKISAWTTRHHPHPAAVLNTVHPTATDVRIL